MANPCPCGIGPDTHLHNRPAHPTRATDADVQAVLAIYFDGQKKRVSVSSFKTVVRACKTLGMTDDAAKVAVLSIFDYGTAHMHGLLLKAKVVTADQVDRSRW